jgi:hypothetical protein
VLAVTPFDSEKEAIALAKHRAHKGIVFFIVRPQKNKTRRR